MYSKLSKVVVGALFALLIVILFAMCLYGGVFSKYSDDKFVEFKVASDDGSQIEAVGLTNFHWENKSNTLTDKDIELFEKYDIDKDSALSATDVYVQEEVVGFEEIIPRSRIPKDVIIPANFGDTPTREEIHNKGYVKFITKAYAIGFWDGAVVYHIEETVEQLKPFFMHNTDNLIIRHGYNAQSFSQYFDKMRGSISNPYTIRNKNGSVEQGEDYSLLTPNIHGSGAGVYYSFKVGGYDTVKRTYGNATIKGDYYLLAMDITTVQPIYVYNVNLFMDALPIVFDTTKIDINGAYIMSGAPMLLSGYKR